MNQNPHGNSRITDILFNIAFFLVYLFLNYKSKLFGTYKIVLDLIDGTTRNFSGSDIQTQFDLHTSILYSNDSNEFGKTKIVTKLKKLIL